MKPTLLFLLCISLLAYCSPSASKKTQSLELKDIANLAFNRQVKSVVDTLQLDAEELTFMDARPGVPAHFIVKYGNKGTLTFFIEPSYLSRSGFRNKKEQLNGIAGKTIVGIDWTGVDGKKGSVKNARIY